MRTYWQLTALAAAAPMLAGSAAMAQPYGPGGGGYGHGFGYGMMGGYGFGYGAVHFIFWAVILAAIIVGVVWLVRSMTGGGGHPMHMPPKRSSGLEVLEERYARGEINREEYLEKKKDLGG